MSSTSENNNDIDTNKQDVNNNKFDKFMTMGVDLL
jgi:hypothetical protein